MRVGPSGFIYYVDHVAKKSQWERPIRGKLVVYFICCHGCFGNDYGEKVCPNYEFSHLFQNKKGHCIAQKYKGRHQKNIIQKYSLFVLTNILR